MSRDSQQEDIQSTSPPHSSASLIHLCHANTIDSQISQPQPTEFTLNPPSSIPLVLSNVHSTSVHDIIPQTTFHLHLLGLPPLESSSLGMTHILLQVFKLATDIHKSRCFMVSNSLVHAPNNFFTLDIYNINLQIYLPGHNTLTGGYPDFCSFQPKANTCLAVPCILKFIIISHQSLPNFPNIMSHLHIDKIQVDQHSQPPPPPLPILP